MAAAAREDARDRQPTTDPANGHPSRARRSLTIGATLSLALAATAMAAGALFAPADNFEVGDDPSPSQSQTSTATASVTNRATTTSRS